MKGSILALAALCAAACGPGSRNGNGDDDDNSCIECGDAGHNCAAGTEMIYTIDQFGPSRFSSFDPSTKTFQDLGNLTCPASGGATPFSMSVDRSGYAWVLYNNGELFTVSVNDVAHCNKTTWTGGGTLKVFGMGYSTNEAGGDNETLFVGGGLTQMQANYTLASIDTNTMSYKVLGQETFLPEMTGTGNAELWGYMPEPTTARIVKFDKTNGAALTTYQEPTLGGVNTGYAFAHWGGDFWVFLIRNAEPSTTVYQVDGMTGMIKGTTPTTARTIVGAGVSTCAPTVIL